jgi:hypothetical protein
LLEDIVESLNGTVAMFINISLEKAWNDDDRNEAKPTMAPF